MSWRCGGEQALVESRPLVWDGERLSPAEAIEEVAAWSVGGSTLLDGLSAGDTVALHWDWICDVLTEEQVRRVEDAELRQLRASASVALTRRPGTLGAPGRPLGFGAAS